MSSCRVDQRRCNRNPGKMEPGSYDRQNIAEQGPGYYLKLSFVSLSHIFCQVCIAGCLLRIESAVEHPTFDVPLLSTYGGSALGRRSLIVFLVSLITDRAMAMATRESKLSGLFPSKSRSKDQGKSLALEPNKSTPRGLKGDEEVLMDNLDDVEQELRRLFDMDTKYGPCSGLTRLERFHRAEKLGLEPPSWVETVIHKYGIESDLNQHVFSPGKV